MGDKQGKAGTEKGTMEATYMTTSTESGRGRKLRTRQGETKTMAQWEVPRGRDGHIGERIQQRRVEWRGGGGVGVRGGGQDCRGGRGRRNDAEGDGRGIGGEWCIKRSRGCSGRRRLHIGRDIRGCRRSRSRGESWGG